MKRGFELSFNFIVSIIIIAFIIAAAGYAIKYFLGLKSCADVGLFYNDLQREIDKSWNSEIAQQAFEGNVPGGIEKICIGSVSAGRDSEEYKDLRRYALRDYSLFFYPSGKACDQGAFKLEHIDNATRDSFKCYDAVKGKIRLQIRKDSASSLVTIS